MYRLAALALLARIGCAKTSLPELFGVTMVEETNCIGQGGQILEAPDGPFCAEG
jgi:hypothetical protein